VGIDQHCSADTGQVRAADHSEGDLPYPGQSRHQDAHQQSYDRDHDQQLNQCKTFSFSVHFLSPLLFSRFAKATVLRHTLVLFFSSLI